MRDMRHCDSGGRLSRRYGECPAGVRHNREFSEGALQAGEKWTAGRRLGDDLHGGPARRAGVVYRKRRLCGLEHK